MISVSCPQLRAEIPRAGGEGWGLVFPFYRDRSLPLENVLHPKHGEEIFRCVPTPGIRSALCSEFVLFSGVPRPPCLPWLQPGQLCCG